MVKILEDKELLLRDLCARLPYGVILLAPNGRTIYQTDGNTGAELFVGEGWKPYLRSMSSMTEEDKKQRKELGILIWSNSSGEIGFDGFGNISAEDTIKVLDWLNAHYFDYRDLIEKGLALEAPEGMYNLKEK